MILVLAVGTVKLCYEVQLHWDFAALCDGTVPGWLEQRGWKLRHQHDQLRGDLVIDPGRALPDPSLAPLCQRSTPPVRRPYTDIWNTEYWQVLEWDIFWFYILHFQKRRNKCDYKVPTQLGEIFVCRGERLTNYLDNKESFQSLSSSKNSTICSSLSMKYFCLDW